MKRNVNYFGVSKPMDKEAFISHYKNITELVQLFCAPFGFADSIPLTFGPNLSKDLLLPLYRQWEELISRRICSWKGISEDLLASALHEYVETDHNPDVISAVRKTLDAINDVIELPDLIFLPDTSSNIISDGQVQAFLTAISSEDSCLALLRNVVILIKDIFSSFYQINEDQKGEILKDILSSDNVALDSFGIKVPKCQFEPSFLNSQCFFDSVLSHDAFDKIEDSFTIEVSYDGSVSRVHYNVMQYYFLLAYHSRHDTFKESLRKTLQEIGVVSDSCSDSNILSDLRLGNFNIFPFSHSIFCYILALQDSLHNFQADDEEGIKRHRSLVVTLEAVNLLNEAKASMEKKNYKHALELLNNALERKGPLKASENDNTSDHSSDADDHEESGYESMDESMEDGQPFFSEENLKNLFMNFGPGMEVNFENFEEDDSENDDNDDDNDDDDDEKDDCIDQCNEEFENTKEVEHHPESVSDPENKEDIAIGDLDQTEEEKKLLEKYENIFEKECVDHTIIVDDKELDHTEEEKSLLQKYETIFEQECVDPMTVVDEKELDHTEEEEKLLEKYETMFEKECVINEEPVNDRELDHTEEEKHLLEKYEAMFDKECVEDSSNKLEVNDNQDQIDKFEKTFYETCLNDDSIENKEATVEEEDPLLRKYEAMFEKECLQSESSSVMSSQDVEDAELDHTEEEKELLEKYEEIFDNEFEEPPKLDDPSIDITEEDKKLMQHYEETFEKEVLEPEVAVNEKELDHTEEEKELLEEYEEVFERECLRGDGSPMEPENSPVFDEGNDRSSWAPFAVLPECVMYPLLAQKAHCLMELQQFSEAKVAANASVAINKRYAPAYNVLAKCATEEGNLEEASFCAMASFLVGGSNDLELAGLAEDAAREACRTAAKEIFAERMKKLKNSVEIVDNPENNCHKLPQQWFVQSYFAGYELLSDAFGVLPLILSHENHSSSDISESHNENLPLPSPELLDKNTNDDLEENPCVIREMDREAYKLIRDIVELFDKQFDETIEAKQEVTPVSSPRNTSVTSKLIGVVEGNVNFVDHLTVSLESGSSEYLHIGSAEYTDLQDFESSDSHDSVNSVATPCVEGGFCKSLSSVISLLRSSEAQKMTGVAVSENGSILFIEKYVQEMVADDDVEVWEDCSDDGAEEEESESDDEEDDNEMNEDPRITLVSRTLRARLLNICASVAFVCGDSTGALECLRCSLNFDSHFVDSYLKLGALQVDMDEHEDVSLNYSVHYIWVVLHFAFSLLFLMMYF